MSRKKKDVDYLSVSARIRVLETRLLNKERMERMIEARELSDAAKVLTECGYPDLPEVTPSAVDEMLTRAQAELVRDLSSAVGESALTDVFLSKTDYHNAKVLVKAEGLHADYDRLLLRGGRFDPETLAKDFRREDLRAYPEIFRGAIARAREVLGATGDPQLADFALDRAYFAELTALAKESGSGFLEGYVALSIDAANLRCAVRAARLEKGPEFLREALTPGGTVAPGDIAATPGDALGALFQGGLLAKAAEAGAALARPGAGALTDFERLCDDAVTAYLSRARYIPFGEQPVIGYLYARQAEATAIRTILSGRMAGLDGATIRQRLRQSYS